MTKEDQAVDSKTETSNIEQEKVSDLEQQIVDLNERMLRTMAETENLRKRYEKQIEDTREYSIVSFAKDLIAVIDNLERAIKFLPENPMDEVKGIIDGVVMTHKQLESVLRLHGVSAIIPKIGDKFDYNLHHAISFVESDDVEDDHIVDLMQVGYKIKDRLLRPAGVSVAKNNKE